MPEFNPPLSARFRAKNHEFDDIWTFIFDKPLEVEFVAGQYAYWLLPNLGEGDFAERVFSIASPPEADYLQITTHIRENSPYDQALAELELGDEIKIRKISGQFVLPEDFKEIVLIAGGIGVTPFRAMLLDNRSKNYDFVLVQVSSGQYLFNNDFIGLPIEWRQIVRDQVDLLLQELTRSHPQARYFISGPPSFVTDLKSKVKDLGISEEQIKLDEFEGYK